MTARALLQRLAPLIRGANKWFVAGACFIAGVTLLIYRPVIDVGFWSDDYGLIGYAARLAPWDYIVFYFDPRLQTIWYRPLQGVELGVAYVLFRSDPLGYHVLQLLLHVANCLLLFGLVARITRNWRAGLLAGLVFAILPTYNLAVYWATVAEPLLTVFCVLTLWLWIDYLETGKARWAALTYGALVCALLTKEVAAVLPAALFLADRWLVNKRESFASLVRRYVPFLVILGIYGLIEYKVITQGVYTRDSGYGIGLHVVPVVLEYLTRLTFPWGIPAPLSYLWLALVLAAAAYLAFRRERRLLFVAAIGLLTVIPVMPFRQVLLRYMYLPLMATAAAYGIAGEYLIRRLERLDRVRWAGMRAAALALSLVVAVNGTATGADAASFAGYVRDDRLQFRPIFQLHASLPKETFFYFVDPPFLSWNLNGLVTLRYGAKVTASGLDYETQAGLRDHQVAYAVYRDDHSTLREQWVDPGAAVRASPAPPVRFAHSIALDGYELVNNRVAPGGAIIMLVYWSIGGKVDKNYTVFAHLVDQSGATIAGRDSQPKRGTAPTSTWQVTGRETVDAVVVPIDDSVPIGDNYRLEIGLYDESTMQRLAVVDANGSPFGDKVEFAPFGVVAQGTDANP